MKTCSKCRETKAVEEFFKDGSRLDGRSYICKVCEKVRLKLCQKKNPEPMRQAGDRWRRKNLQHVNAVAKAWKEANPNRMLAYREGCNKSWRQKNPGASVESAKRRELLCKQAVPTWVDRAQMRKVYEAAREYGFQVDHIVPLRHPLVCGLHVGDNLQLLAPHLNAWKSNKFWPDMPGEVILKVTFPHGLPPGMTVNTL